MTVPIEKPPVRLIARMDIKSRNVVKGVHLEGLRVVGKPADLAKKYYRQGIDEIIYMDIVASLYGRNNILSVVEEAAQHIFVPLTVGGGIRSIEDIVAALRSGADKVAINTAAIARPDFIREASRAVGSQAVVVSIEAQKRDGNWWEAQTDNGRERTGINVLEWAQKAEELGAGELLVTSIDKEGTQKGFDLELVSAIRNLVQIPVIVSGGAGSPQHCTALVEHSDADALACAAIFHYDKHNPAEVKVELAANGIPVRAVTEEMVEAE